MLGDYYFALPSFGGFRASGGFVSGNLGGLPLSSDSPFYNADLAQGWTYDPAKAKALPGVIAVFTGEDMTDINPLPCAWQAAAGRVQNNLNTPRAIRWPSGPLPSPPRACRSRR